MWPRTQKQPQVKKELCRVLDDVDVDVDVETGNLINFVSVFEVLSFPFTYCLFLLQISMNVLIFFLQILHDTGSFLYFPLHFCAGNRARGCQKCTHLRMPGFNRCVTPGASNN